MHGCPSTEVQEVGYGRFKKGRDRPNEYWEKVIKQDMAQLQLNEGMTLDRKV